MRHIGSIPDETDAKRFGDYLLSAGMKNSVEEGSAGWAVWVEHDDHLDRAKAELEAFRANPADPKYDGATRRAEKIRSEEQKKQQRLRKRFIDVRTRWGQPQRWAQPLTIVLIAASVLVSFFTGLGHQMHPVGTALQIASITPEQEQAWEAGDPRAGEQLFNLAQVRRGQVWRLFTPIFLHFHILHLLFNMFWLRDLGSMIELNRGTGFLLLLVLGSALASNLAEYYWSGHPWFGGMSGVVYAMFGYVWIKGKYEPHLGMSLMPQTITLMFVWLVACMLGILGDNIANAAHVIGLAAGVAVAYGPIELRRIRRRLKS